MREIREAGEAGEAGMGGKLREIAGNGGNGREWVGMGGVDAPVYDMNCDDCVYKTRVMTIQETCNEHGNPR